MRKWKKKWKLTVVMMQVVLQEPELRLVIAKEVSQQLVLHNQLMKKSILPK